MTAHDGLAACVAAKTDINRPCESDKSCEDDWKYLEDYHRRADVGSQLDLTKSNDAFSSFYNAVSRLHIVSIGNFRPLRTPKNRS